MKPTQEQVIAWAREAGITFQTHQGISGRLRTLTEGSQSIQRIETIAALAYEAGRQDENEECALICDHEMDNAMNFGMAVAAGNCADKIRARREQ